MVHVVRAAAMERCTLCGQTSLPECLGCGSRAIVREGANTSCVECELDTLCPCAFGFHDWNADTEGDGALVF